MRTRRQADEERRSLSRSTLDPDLASMGLDDLGAESQADSRTLKFVGGMKPAKRLENRVVEPGVDADAIVADEERLHAVGISSHVDRLARRFAASDLDMRLRAAVVLDGIAD